MSRKRVSNGMRVIQDMIEHTLASELASAKRLRDRIDALPKGSLQERNVGDHVLRYLIWREGAKVKKSRIPDKDVCRIRREIEERKILENQYKENDKDIIVARRFIKHDK